MVHGCEMAIALRARGGRNMLLQTRGLPAQDVKEASKQVVATLALHSSAGSRGGADTAGDHPPNFSRGCVVVNNGRHKAVYRLVNTVFVIGVGGPSVSIFALSRLVDAVTKQLVLICRSPEVTLDKVAKKYAEIYVSVGATLETGGNNPVKAAAASAGLLMLILPEDKRYKKQKKKASDAAAEVPASFGSLKGASAGAGGVRRSLVDGPRISDATVDQQSQSPSAARRSSALAMHRSADKRMASSSPDSSYRGGGSYLTQSKSLTQEGSNRTSLATDTDWAAFDGGAVGAGEAFGAKQPPGSPAAPWEDDPFGPAAGPAATTVSASAFAQFADSSFGETSMADTTQQTFAETPIKTGTEDSFNTWDADPFSASTAAGAATPSQTDGSPWNAFNSSAQPAQQAPPGVSEAKDFSSYSQEKRQGVSADPFGQSDAFSGASSTPASAPVGFGTFSDSEAQPTAPGGPEGFASFGDTGGASDGFGTFDALSGPQAVPSNGETSSAMDVFGSDQAIGRSPVSSDAGGFADFSKPSPPAAASGVSSLGDSSQTQSAGGFAHFGSSPQPQVPESDAFATFGEAEPWADPTVAGHAESPEGFANFGGASAEPAAGRVADFGGNSPEAGPAGVTAVAAVVGGAAGQRSEAKLLLVEVWEGSFRGAVLAEASVTAEVQLSAGTVRAPPGQFSLAAAVPPSSPLLPLLQRSLLAVKVKDGAASQGSLAGTYVAEAEAGDVLTTSQALVSYSLPPAVVLPPLMLKVSFAKPHGSVQGGEEVMVVQYAVSPALGGPLQEVHVEASLPKNMGRPLKACPAVEWSSSSARLQWALPPLPPGYCGCLRVHFAARALTADGFTDYGLTAKEDETVGVRMHFKGHGGQTFSGVSLSPDGVQSAVGIATATSDPDA